VIVGVDAEGEAGRGGLLESLKPDELPREQSVVIGEALANRLSIAPGQSIAIIGQDANGYPVSDLFRVRGIVKSSVDIVKTMGVVMSVADAAELLDMPDKAHEIIVHGEDYDRAEALAARIAQLPALAGAEVLWWRESLPELGTLIDLKGWFDLIFLAIVFVAAAAGIANTATMSTFERTHEFGMLLAVGEPGPGGSYRWWSSNQSSSDWSGWLSGQSSGPPLS
jgi:ABC-type lipoprotein release transport system permease subunit